MLVNGVWERELWEIFVYEYALEEGEIRVSSIRESCVWYAIPCV